jgi:hypothetical protein
VRKSWMCLRCSDAANLRGRRCAFTPSGRFRKNNWNCETMIALREAAFFRHRDDFVNGSIGVVEMPDDTGPRDDVKGFLVLTWYKDRGGSPGAIIVADEGKQHALTLARAQRILEARNV